MFDSHWLSAQFSVSIQKVQNYPNPSQIQPCKLGSCSLSEFRCLFSLAHWLVRLVSSFYYCYGTVIIYF